MGKDVFSLLLKAGTYDKMALFQKRRLGARLGNAILWGIAIAAATCLEISLIVYTKILPFNAAISISATYQLFE